MEKNRINEFMTSVITEMEEQGRYSTAHVYKYALNAVLAYGGESVNLEELTPEWLLAYQSYLSARLLLWNTISTYMRMLRAVYNRAVDSGLVPYIPRQFKGVYTGRILNHQRAMDRDNLQRILSPDESGSIPEEQKEDTEYSSSHFNSRWAQACLELMLRFHGMPFVDLAHLRKSDLHNGHLTVRRRKTGRVLSVAVSPAALRLIRRYGNTDPSSPYLLDILDGNLTGREAYEDYQHALRMLNLRLRQLTRRYGMSCKVTSYSARHSWATLAKYCGVAVEVISEALGHASITTTEGYLKQFDNQRIEKANAVIMNYIFRQ